MSEAVFTYTAGILIRGQVKDFVKDFCQLKRLGCEIREERGILDSIYVVKVVGDDEGIRQFSRTLYGLLKEFS